jgi:hypothetical protein
LEGRLSRSGKGNRSSCKEFNQDQERAGCCEKVQCLAIAFPSNYLLGSSIVDGVRLEGRIWATQNLPILPKAIPIERELRLPGDQKDLKKPLVDHGSGCGRAKYPQAFSSCLSGPKHCHLELSWPKPTIVKDAIRIDGDM